MHADDHIDDLVQLEALRDLDALEREQFKHYLRFETRQSGEVLLEEGRASRAMFFLLKGQACVVRGSLQLGRIHAGAHAGELSLISGRARSATVTALEQVELAWLTPPAFEQLKNQAPALALKLEQALIHQLGLQLTDITDQFGQLLQERSLPRRLTVNVNRDGQIHSLPTGTPVGDCLPAAIAGKRVVAALMNHKLTSLLTPVMSDVDLEALTTEHWEGQRILRRSAALLLLEAAARLRPDLKLNMALSVGGTQWIQAENPETVDWEALKAELEPLLQNLITQELPFRQEIWSVEEAMLYFEEAGRLDGLELLSTSAHSTVALASCGQYYALASSPLVPHAGYLEGLEIQTATTGLVLTIIAGGPSLQALEAYAGAVKSHNRWLQSMGIQSVGHLNRLAIQGEVGRLIQVAEGFHEKRIGQIADQISERGARVICIAGPSSSGKTTFIRRLSIQLLVNGLNPVAVSLDDYYRERDQIPLDEQGEYDLEALTALNLPLLQTHISQLMQGEQVATARYDFAAARSLPEGGPVLTLGQQDVLLLEGIHGLNPALFEAGTDLGQVFKIFIQPMSALAIDELARINPSDLRLLRRIIRDRHGRATLAADNIMRWSSVRAGEQRWIFPFVDQADEIFDSSLAYELLVLKVYAERYLLEVPRNHAAYATAHRLHQMVQHFVALYPDHVPQNSLLREFISSV